MSKPTQAQIEAAETNGKLLQRLGADAALWAAEFHKTAINLGYSDMDEGWLIGWFANAIENTRAVDRAALTSAAEVGDNQMSFSSNIIEAAVAATIERCARVADSFCQSFTSKGPFGEAAEIAAAIRALKND